MKNTIIVALSSLITLSTQTHSASQIIPDQTLPVNSILSVDEQKITIQGGTQQGNNLFHSFQLFNVETGQSVLFDNPLNTLNIFSRVTGNHPSVINGIMGANDTANLFFINPNGITFGENANISLGGSFVTTTAHQIHFADGTVFDALSPHPPQLTLSTPIGLQFSSQHNGPITLLGKGHQFSSIDLLTFPKFNSQGLVANSQTNIILAGGNLVLKGGIIRAVGGNIHLGAFKEGFVHLSADFSLIAHPNTLLADIFLTQRSALDSSGLTQGNIFLQGENLVLNQGSLLFNETINWENQGIISIRAKTIEISGTDEFSLIPGGIRTQSLLDGIGANIVIESEQLTLLEGGVIQTFSFSEKAAGDLTFNVDQLEVTGVSPRDRRAGSNISSVSANLGRSGNILLNSNSIILTEGGSVSSIAAISSSGDIIANTQTLRISGIEETTAIPSSISSVTITGQASNVIVNSQQLTIEKGARIDSSSFGSGDAGLIELNNQGVLKITEQNSLITSSVVPVFETIQQLFPLPSFEILTGNSGNINISTEQLHLAQGGRIQVTNQGSGNAGFVHIETDSLHLQNLSQISATTLSGQGGNLFLNSDRISLDNSQISATAGGIGDGGNIVINTDNGVFLQNNSAITSDAFAGDGGNITINTKALFQDPTSSITASSELGIDGTIEINQFFDNLRKNLPFLALRPSQQETIRLNIGCNDVELIDGIELHTTTTMDSEVVARVIPQQGVAFPANAVEIRDGQLFTVYHLSKDDFNDLGCPLQKLPQKSEIFPQKLLVTPDFSSPIINNIQLKKIEFQGNFAISTRELENQVKPFLDKPYSLEELSLVIQEIQSKITQLYRQKGYLFSGAFIAPEQEVVEGTLKVEIQEKGEIKSTQIEGLKRMRASYINKRLFALLKTPFNIDNVVFALTTLQNDRRFNKVSGELKRDENNELILAITVEEAPAFEVGIKGNNYNSYLVGENQLEFKLASVNLTGLADEANFLWWHTEGSDQFYFDYSIPVNGLGGRLKATLQQGNSVLLISPLDQFDIQQVAKSVKLDYYQPIHRGQYNEVALFVGLEYRQNESRVLGQLFSLNSNVPDARTRFVPLSIGQEWIHRNNNYAFLVRNELRFGLDWFKATVYDNDLFIDGQFFLWRSQIQSAHELTPALLFRVSLWGQLSPDSLPFGERIQLGGFYTVPGYVYNFISGDNGVFGQLALQYRIFKSDKWGNLTLIPAFSVGFVDNNNFPSPVPDTIGSTSLGIRYELDWFYARFDCAWPLTGNVRHQNLLGEFGFQFTF